MSERMKGGMKKERDVKIKAGRKVEKIEPRRKKTVRVRSRAAVARKEGEKEKLVDLYGIKRNLYWGKWSNSFCLRRISVYSNT